MKKIISKKISKIYGIWTLLLAMIILASYTSYALFAVRKEKNNAISIATGNLNYVLKSTNLTNNQLQVAANTTKIIEVQIESMNTIASVYQMYYQNNGNITIKYKSGADVPFGSNIGAVGESNAVKTVTLMITNTTGSIQNVILGVQGGLSSHTLTLENGRTAIYKKDAPPIMRTYRNNDTLDYHNSTYRSKVTSIVTKTNTLIPTTAIAIENGKGNYWDVSQEQDDSVIAYAEDDGQGGYKITIGGDGMIIANTDCNKLFSGFSNVTNFDLTHLNTTNVESMAMMFSGCSSITSIDVSKFDTSKVRFMNSMFAGCSYLQSIDLRNFNTSKVETMSGMFAICNYLSHVNLTSFDTSSLQSTFLMFERCGLYSSNGMTILVSSRWNLDNVDVTGMFSGCVTDHVTVV